MLRWPRAEHSAPQQSESTPFEINREIVAGHHGERVSFN